MPILAIETSTMVSSVAVADENKLYSELTVQTRLTHSETLMPHIEEALKLADTKREALTAISVSIGPGSFTGLRIGLASAKAMAYALNIPLIGIPTLEALAYQYQAPNLKLYPLVDAQKGNVYVAGYIWKCSPAENQNIPSKPAELLHLDTLCQLHVDSLANVIEQLKESAEPVMVLGDMAVKKLIPAATKGELPNNIILAPIHTIMPRAACVATAAIHRLATNDIDADAIMGLEPIYIRKSEAELLWEKKQAKQANKE